MTTTGTSASASAWSLARRQKLPDDASSRARPSGRDETKESSPWTDICLRVEKAHGGAVAREVAK